MIDNIIQSVTEKLSSLPYIEGIVLGGSRARGTHTEDSDIDIGIYYKSESFDITAINQIATELDDENRNNLVVPPGAWGERNCYCQLSDWASPWLYKCYVSWRIGDQQDTIC